MYFYLLKMRSIFFKENSIFSIKLGQRLPKTFSQLCVKNSKFFLSYFLKKYGCPKAYASPSLPTLLYRKKYLKGSFSCKWVKKSIFFFIIIRLHMHSLLKPKFSDFFSVFPLIILKFSSINKSDF